VILLDPSMVNFQVDTGLMLPQVNQFRSNATFWTGFWDYLWLKPGQANDIPLRATYSQERLQAFLNDVAARYDRPGTAPSADPDTLGFVSGEPGHALEIDEAVSLVDASLRSPANRVVTLPVSEQTVVRPSFDTLAELIEVDVGLFQFSGIFSLHLTDLDSGRELSLNLDNQVPVEGEIAFSGMSTIKVPIMVSFFAQHDGPLSAELRLLLERSIDASQNAATDELLRVIGEGDGFEGTRRVTADMQRLGLENTYISGLLDTFGAVLLPLNTPANSRSDLNTGPDPYNQTTAEDMGTMMVMIYQCSNGGGALMAAYPGKFTAEECRLMIEYLSDNQVGPIFITGGSEPDGVVAHKHGWDALPLTNVADAAIVFTPTGTYGLTVFVHRRDTMTFDEANRFIISISRAVYNYFNWSI
jgi:beta-lactamase class A